MSNTLAIKSNFEIAKEHNLLIEKRLDMLAKQETEHNEIIDAKQDLLAKQEREHNELIEAKLDMVAKREKETCSPPKPVVQPLATVDGVTGAQLEPKMDPIKEEIPVSIISDNL